MREYGTLKVSGVTTLGADTHAPRAEMELGRGGGGGGGHRKCF